MPDSTSKKPTDSSFCSALKTAALISGAALGAAAAANALIAWNTPTASPQLSGAFNRTPMRYGDVAYAVSGSGSPVLLLHAPRRGGSSAEWSENFEALAQNYTVYALDFLGWGLSDKPHHTLFPEDYAEQILWFIRDIIGEKCAVVTSGAAANFALQAAREAPELFSKLVLICPQSTSDQSTSGKSTSGQSTFPKSTLGHRLFTLPIVGETLMNWFSSRRQLESKAREKLYFDSKHITHRTVSRMHVAAHQPGTQHAYAAYFAGLLATHQSEDWSTLPLPALLIWGREATEPEIASATEWLALNPNARLEVFDNAKLLPHVEHADAFNARLLSWLKN